MKILLLAAALFSALSAAPASPGEKTDLQELFRSLDRVIARSGEYTARRESRIDSLKRALTRDGLSLRERFDLTERLAENYNSYQSDFALLYLRRTLALAEETGDNDLIMRARSGIALCYSLGGRFYEAEEILSGIRDTVHVSRRALQSYYVARHRMNRELYALTEPGERRDLFRRREHYYAVSAEEIGNPVHPGTQRELARHGLPRSGHRAWQLGKADYDRYDLFIGMDRENLRRMERIFGGDPLHKIALLMAYTGEPREIEDPWYTDRYDVVYDEVDAGCEALLNELEQERRIKGKHYE